MPNPVAFFAIHADDVARARAFYEAVFGWRFEPWGPPDFYLIETGEEGDSAPSGALHGRMEPLTGTGMRGFECSIAVASADETLARLEAAGGTVMGGKAHIPGVGWVVRFTDPEGNMAAAVQYEARP